MLDILMVPALLLGMHSFFRLWGATPTKHECIQAIWYAMTAIAAIIASDSDIPFAWVIEVFFIFVSVMIVYDSYTSRPLGTGYSLFKGSSAENDRLSRH